MGVGKLNCLSRAMGGPFSTGLPIFANAITDVALLERTNVNASSVTFSDGFVHGIPNPENSIVGILGHWTSVANATPISCTVNGVSLQVSGRFIGSSGTPAIGAIAFDVAAASNLSGDVIVNFGLNIEDFAGLIFSCSADGVFRNANGRLDTNSPFTLNTFNSVADEDLVTIGCCATDVSDPNVTALSIDAPGVDVIGGERIVGDIRWRAALIRETVTTHTGASFSGTSPGLGNAVLAVFNYGRITDI